MLSLTKLKNSLLAVGVFIVSVLFFALKLIRVGQTAAKAEVYQRQREIEDRALNTLKNEEKKSNESIEQNEDRITNGDYSGFNDPR